MTIDEIVGRIDWDEIERRCLDRFIRFRPAPFVAETIDWHQQFLQFIAEEEIVLAIYRLAPAAIPVPDYCWLADESAAIANNVAHTYRDLDSATPSN